MKRRMTLCVFVPVALVVTACGSDDDSSTDTTAAPAEEPAATEAAEEPAATEAAEEPAATEAAEEPAATEAAEEPAADEAAEPDPSSETDLWANVPEVPNATEAEVRPVQEGGIQAIGTIEAPRDEIVPSYTALLEKNGWTVESSGGDPAGEFGGGVQATYDDGRYLSLGFGGEPGSTTFGQLCVWPTTPNDTDCPQGGQDDGDQSDGDQDDGDAGPPEEVEGFIPDFAEQFIP